MKNLILGSATFGEKLACMVGTPTVMTPCTVTGASSPANCCLAAGYPYAGRANK